MNSRNSSTRARLLAGAAATVVAGGIVSIGVVRAAEGRPVDAAPVVEPAGATVAPPVDPPALMLLPAVSAVAEAPEPSAVTGRAVPIGAPSATSAPSSDPARRPVAVATEPAAVIDRVVLVGDSLAHEASSVVRFLTPGKEMVRKYYGGTAPCDWLDDDLEATPTSVVVISFTGNNVTDCMLDSNGVSLVDQALVDRYQIDVGILIDRATAAGAWVVLVGQPRHDPVRMKDDEIAGINATYQWYAASRPQVVFVDAGHQVETPGGEFTYRLPCIEQDPDCAADGTTAVRHDDGVHFCPVAGVNPCPVWSSGAVRFGGAIAAVANDPALSE